MAAGPTPILPGPSSSSSSADPQGAAQTTLTVDHASGARNDRPQFRAMLEGARRRQFDVLLVWRYDRFARSMRELVNALEEFNSLGVDFISFNEGADTTTAQGRLLFGIMASLAEFERSLIAERVKAGMQRARAQGKHTGRPAIPPEKLLTIHLLLRDPKPPSDREIARRVGVSYQTVGDIRRGKRRGTGEKEDALAK